MPIFEDLFRPKGIGEIRFTHQATHIQFKWDGQNGIVYLNENEWGKLSPAIKYFVLMHEWGHLKTMPLFANKASLTDEINADNYALTACLKVGVFLQSVEAARILYQSQINQSLN